MPHADPAKRRESNRAAVDRYRERHPDRVRANQARQHAKHSYATDEKLRARRILQKAKATGRVFAEPCLFCDDPASAAHHHDYSKPLDVTWLCSRHHGIAHRTLPIAA